MRSRTTSRADFSRYLYRISTRPDVDRPFAAGLVTDKDGIVTRTAPILYRLFHGRSMASVAAVCANKGWKVEHLG